MERSIQTNIIRALRQRGAYVVNIKGGDGIDAGTPDLIACYQGWFVALEVKQPKKTMTAIQQHRRSQIIDAGGVCAEVHSVQEALDVIEGLSAL